MTLKNFLFPYWFACFMVTFATLMLMGGAVVITRDRSSEVIWSGTCPVIWDNAIVASCGENTFIPLQTEKKYVDMLISGKELTCSVSTSIFGKSGKCD